MEQTLRRDDRLGLFENTEADPLGGELVVAARDEVSLRASDVVSDIGSHSSVRRLLARNLHRLTPRAARLVAARPTAGAVGTLLAMMGAGRLVLIQRRVERPVAVTHVRRKAHAVPTELPLEAKKRLSWIRFQIVHHATGEPFAGVRLTVRTPGGSEIQVRTDSHGAASLHEIEPGFCDAWCPLQGARLARTAGFVGMGMPRTGAAAGGWSDVSDRHASAECIAHVDEHRVQTGETLESVARQYAYSWRELAEFNWDTSNPDAVNRHLRDDVGCTQKTLDGFNYRFTSEDEPGLIYIPRTWSQSGLATEHTHVIRVRLAAGFRLILENEDGLRIPEAEYEATLADGSVRKGRLGRSGMALIKDPPPGEVEVRYRDLDDIEAKSLAATARKAFDDRQPIEIHRLFRYPSETIRRAFAAYDQYFNDHHGAGLQNDIETDLCTGPDAELIFFGYYASAGMLTAGAPARGGSGEASRV
ncbi:MAG: LysM peptidoglycan-binding domain-containing protein [Phycisphaerae bacterium]